MKPAFDPEKHIEEILKMEKTMHKQDEESVGDKPGMQTDEKPFNFSIKPEELESYLNQYVIGQKETIEVIATKVCTHFNRMMLEEKMNEDQRILGNIKSNMLLVGATGVGKTYIIKLIAKKIGVPFVKADATKFSETGYVGGDVEDIVRELVQEADGDIKRAEYGIIYLDEIDKIASTGNTSGPDVSRSGVQRNLLKLMEEAEVDLKTPHDLASQVEAAMEAQRTGKISHRKINTRNILFIVSGAFGGLDKIINKRLNKQAIGFEKANAETAATEQDVLKNVKTEDLLEFGFESEFIGRLPVCVVLNDLDEEGLFQILKNEHSTVVNGKKRDFKAYGIDISFTDEAFKELARRAYGEKTGARGLLNVFEKTLIKFEKSLPSTEIKELKIDEKMVDNPLPALKDILIKEGITNFQKELLTKTGIYMDFDEEAVKALQEISGDSLKSVKQLCNEMFANYPYGLKLLNLDSFKITREVIENPEGYLNDFIKSNYKKDE